MCSEASDGALMQIEEANLPCTVYRTARRLLDRADYNAGRVTLSEEEFMAICQTDAVGTMRSHLIKLANAGVIRYKRRGDIAIQFEAWPQLQPAAHRALSDHVEDKVDEEVIAERSLSVTDEEIRALSDHFDDDASEEVIAQRSHSVTGPPIRALSDHISRAERSKSVSTSHAGSVSSLVTTDLPSPGKDELTNKPAKTKKPRVVTDPDEIARSVRLLTDSEVGLAPRTADKLAVEHPHAYLETQVYEWRRDLLAKKVSSNGALFNRIKDNYGGTITPADRDTDLYRRHHPEYNPLSGYKHFDGDDPYAGWTEADFQAEIARRDAERDAESEAGP